jgi:hypothetical protein
MDLSSNPNQQQSLQFLGKARPLTAADGVMHPAMPLQVCASSQGMMTNYSGFDK